MIAGVRQRCVIQSPGLLADTERLAADLQHQRLPDHVADLVCAVIPKHVSPSRTMSSSPPVKVMADGSPAVRIPDQSGAQQGNPFAPGVDDDRARPDSPGCGETADQSR